MPNCALMVQVHGTLHPYAHMRRHPCMHERALCPTPTRMHMQVSQFDCMHAMQLYIASYIPNRIYTHMYIYIASYINLTILRDLV